MNKHGIFGLTRNEFDKLFSKYVVDYIKDGYTIFFNKMLYGNEAYHVQLRKGNQLAEVRAYEGFESFELNGKHYFGKTLSIYIGEQEFDPSMYSNSFDIKNMVLFHKFYCSFERKEKYLTDRNNFMKMQDIHRERSRALKDVQMDLDYRDIKISDDLKDKMKAVAIKYVNRQPRCKSKKASDISNITKRRERVNGAERTVYNVYISTDRKTSVYKIY